MDQPLPICFGVENTDPTVPLGIRVWIDDNIIYENLHVVDGQDVTSLVPDIEGPHTFVFEMFGKLPEHTKVDEQGNIVQDAVLKIDGVKFDDIEIDQLLSEQAVYQHDFNGNGPQVQEKFYGAMGCCGRVTLQFESPVYLWLLENL